jgi:hypothetical protein
MSGLSLALVFTLGSRGDSSLIIIRDPKAWHCSRLWIGVEAVVPSFKLQLNLESIIRLNSLYTHHGLTEDCYEGLMRILRVKNPLEVIHKPNLYQISGVQTFDDFPIDDKSIYPTNQMLREFLGQFASQVSHNLFCNEDSTATDSQRPPNNDRVTSCHIRVRFVFKDSWFGVGRGHRAVQIRRIVQKTSDNFGSHQLFPEKHKSKDS